MLRRVIAIEYMRPMKSGRTSPLLLKCAHDDNSIVEVVVKFSEFCDQHQENLAVEAFAACLAGDLGLPIPEPVLVEISDEWAQIVPDSELKRKILSSSRVAFGSRLVTGGYSVWTPSTQISEAMVNIAAAIFAFDGIIQNVHRRTKNPNCLVRGESIRIFDHELAFGHKLMLNWQPPWARNGLNWLETIGAHIFRSQLLKRSQINFDEIRSAWIAVTDIRLAEYENALPVEWSAASSRIADAVSLVRDARVNIDACITEIQRCCHDREASVQLCNPSIHS